MRDATPRHWSRWRITHGSLPTVGNWSDRLRMPAPTTPTPGEAGRDEKPGPDGIRHELVARIRQEIAAGTYDTEEKWLAAEAELLRRIEERM